MNTDYTDRKKFLFLIRVIRVNLWLSFWLLLSDAVNRPHAPD